MKIENIGRKAVVAAAEVLFPRACPVCGDIITEDDYVKAGCRWSVISEAGSAAVGGMINEGNCRKRMFPQIEEETQNGEPFECLAVNLYICRFCYERLKFAGEPKCFKCGRPLDDEETEFCCKCREVRHQYEYGMSLLVHNDSAKRILYDLKYSNLRDNADFLAAETALRLGKRIILLKPDAVIPVPLHKKRQRDRGFNQAELLSEKIINNIESLSGIRLHYDNQILVRHHNTKPQKELKEEKRRLNVKNSFSLVKECRYKKVLLVDDIYTTGSTIDECAGVLKNGGASEVYFLTMSIV